MSDIVNSRKLQIEINNRLDALEKKINDAQCKGAFLELQDLKEWVIKNQVANDTNTSDRECTLHSVTNCTSLDSDFKEALNELPKNTKPTKKRF